MMSRHTIFELCLLILPCSVFFCLVSPALALKQYEENIDLKASSLLPAELFSNKLFKIKEHVKNDGFINTYTVNTDYGSFQVSSNIALYKLLREIEAIEAMKKIQESDVFVASLKDSGAKTVEGLENLFTNPSETLEDAGSGLSNLFSRTNESIFNSSPGEAEDSRVEQTIGFSNAKRKIAFQYKVDVYSNNKTLQEHLDRLAWAEYAGGLTLGVATMPIGGAVGITLSVSGTARLLGEVIATTPPAELKLQNRAKLAQLAIDPNLADLFIENPFFSPLQQTAYVMALEKMTAVKERSLPLQVALQASDQEVARYMTAIMAMFVGYNDKISPIVEFKTIARFFCGVDKNGKFIVVLPADYITLNKRLVSGIESVKGAGMSGYEFWITGTASPAAQEHIKAAGWNLKQKAAEKIGFKMNDKQ